MLQLSRTLRGFWALEPFSVPGFLTLSEFQRADSNTWWSGKWGDPEKGRRSKETTVQPWGRVLRATHSWNSQQREDVSYLKKHSSFQRRSQFDNLEKQRSSLRPSEAWLKEWGPRTHPDPYQQPPPNPWAIAIKLLTKAPRGCNTWIWEAQFGCVHLCLAKQ